jgi:hypothetical protein
MSEHDESQTWACVDLSAGPWGLSAVWHPLEGRLDPGPHYGHTPVPGFSADRRPLVELEGTLRYLDEVGAPFVLYEVVSGADPAQLRRSAQQALARSTEAPDDPAGLDE